MLWRDKAGAAATYILLQCSMDSTRLVQGSLASLIKHDILELKKGMIQCDTVQAALVQCGTEWHHPHTQCKLDHEVDWTALI